MAEIALAFNRVTKHVATHRPESSAGQNTGGSVTIRSRGCGSQAGRRAEAPDPGQQQLVQTLLANDLIDDFRLIVSPLLLGDGKRLFGAGTLPRTLNPVKSATTPQGTLIVDYGGTARWRPDRSLGDPTEAEAGATAELAKEPCLVSRTVSPAEPGWTSGAGWDTRAVPAPKPEGGTHERRECNRGTRIDFTALTTAGP